MLYAKRKHTRPAQERALAGRRDLAILLVVIFKTTGSDKPMW